MKFAALLCATLMAAVPSDSQTPPAANTATAPGALLPSSDALALLKRIAQLMESTTLATPGMLRAAAPLSENVRQAFANIEGGSAQNAAQIHIMLANVRAYLALSDALPKEYPFAEEGRKQMVELRESMARADAHFQALLELKERQVRGSDRDALQRYAEANQRLGRPAGQTSRVVFLGDSITDGWRLEEYFTGREFVNRGISGQITGEMLGRMMADVIDLKPRAVLILAGTNDIARGVPASTIKNNLTMIADLAEVHQIQPLFASILPVNDYHKNVSPRFEMTLTRPPSTIVALNTWLRQFCGQRGYVYVDYYLSMVDSAGFLQADLADDGLHPNAKGYRIMAPIALNAINRAVAQPPKKKKDRSF